MNSSIKDATVSDLVRANTFTKLLKSNEVVLSFSQITDLKNTPLVCFSNTSSTKFGGSQYGLLLFLQERNGKYILFAWQLRMLKKVVKSTSLKYGH